MQIYSKTDIGKRRSSNQDAYLTDILPDGAALAVVCDGMGGANAGNIAAQRAASAILDFIGHSYRNGLNTGELASMLQTAVRSANITVYDLSVNDTALEGMGTTVVAAIVKDGTAVVVHVGDSRAYLIGDGLTQLTRDHSVVQSLIESGKLTPEEARVHPRKNVITRALGIEEDVLVDSGEFTLSAGQTLMLCTDGLTNFVDTSDILKVFGETDISKVADTLCSLANQNGGGDNITVVTLTV